jgi:hypothetical protein
MLAYRFYEPFYMRGIRVQLLAWRSATQQYIAVYLTGAGKFSSIGRILPTTYSWFDVKMKGGR